MKRIACVVLFAASALTACVGGPLDEPGRLGAARLADTAIEGEGARLALSEWRPEGEARAVMLALHGYGDYGHSTFAEAGAFWAERGVHVYAYDQRGFGRNASRGRWQGADALIEDAKSATAAIRAAHPAKPLFVLGHSMGGGVALAALGEGQAAADGLILAAPAVWGGARLAFPLRAAAWSGALLFPEKRWTGEGVVRIQASDNIEVLRSLARDPLYVAPPSSREFMGLIRIMDRAVAAAPSAAVPTLTLWGEKDQVTKRGPIEAAFEALPGEKTFLTYENGWHLLFRDLGALEVWEDVADWIEARS